jgi:hypothetical protein
MPGEVAIGRHDAAVLGVPFTFEVPSSGWISSSEYAGVLGRRDHNGWVSFWSPDRIYADPCTKTLGPPVGPSALDLATAMASIPGTTATGPTDVNLGGLAAKYVEVVIPQDVGCSVNRFLLWSDDVEGPRCASTYGYTIRVWIVGSGGTRIVVDVDDARGDDELNAEMQQIVESIQFQ